MRALLDNCQMHLQKHNRKWIHIDNISRIFTTWIYRKSINSYFLPLSLYHTFCQRELSRKPYECAWLITTKYTCRNTIADEFELTKLSVYIHNLDISHVYLIPILTLSLSHICQRELLRKPQNAWKMRSLLDNCQIHLTNATTERNLNTCIHNCGVTSIIMLPSLLPTQVVSVSAPQ